MSPPVLALPEYLALKSKSNGKYLRYVRDDPNARAVLQFSGDELVSTSVKFQSNAVSLPVDDGRPTTAYHLRCCYNNKYWQKAGQAESYISAGETPDEDTSKWSCTLFKPEFDHHQGTVRLVHVQSGGYLGRGNSQPPPAATGPDCLVVGLPAAAAEVCEVVNYSEAVVMLPKLVAFKGDNGKYLKAVSIDPVVNTRFPIYNLPTFRAIQFSGNEIYDRSVAHEVVMNPVDGTVRIKSVSHDGTGGGRFWRRNEVEGNWIFWDSRDPTFKNKDTVFRVHRLHPSEPQYGLTNCGSDLPCKRYNGSTFQQCLRASGTDVEPYNKLWVEEPVLWRRMYDGDFRTEDARFYPLEPPKVDTEIYRNETPNPSKVGRKFGKTVSHTTSWTNSYGWKVGGKVEITTDFKGIPFLKEGKLEISSEYSEEKTEGASEERGESSEIASEVTVSPMKQLRITTTKTKTACDVPFDYSYTEKLYDGTATDYRVQDGLFTTTTTVVEVASKEEDLQQD
ncbi:unnamed protein product [Linum tenue]|uniref:Agglutinin domain-containing protein n=1 Tax=Linum tenue TaxID=586396 RepID=A0AAV0IB44_9ROSI|nr:unnamed protein product [Linum tenue]